MNNRAPAGRLTVTDPTALTIVQRAPDLPFGSHLPSPGAGLPPQFEGAVVDRVVKLPSNVAH